MNMLYVFGPHHCPPLWPQAKAELATLTHEHVRLCIAGHVNPCSTGNRVLMWLYDLKYSNVLVLGLWRRPPTLLPSWDYNWVSGTGIGDLDRAALSLAHGGLGLTHEAYDQRTRGIAMLLDVQWLGPPPGWGPRGLRPQRQRDYPVRCDTGGELVWDESLGSYRRD